MHGAGESDEGDELDVIVRLPVALDPVLHRRLIRWCQETARSLDVLELSRAAVLEALIEQLDDDPRLSAAVRRRLATAPESSTRAGSGRGAGRGRGVASAG